MPYPASEIDGTIAKAMDQAFMEEVQMFKATLAAANKSAQQLANVTDNMFLQMVQLYQASAAQLVQMDKLAATILAQRSAMNQPQQAPSMIEPVVVKTT